MMPLPLLVGLSALGFLMGCPFPAGRYDLPPPVAAAATVEYLDVSVRPVVFNLGVKGWELELQFDFAARPGTYPFVDPSRTMLRIDGQRWLPCKILDAETGASLRPKMIRFKESSIQSFTLVCSQVPRPNRSIEVRMPATGAGGKGYIELTIDGLRGSLD
jgi:hypothetical protein